MIHRMTDFMSKQADLVANESRKILEHEQVRSHWLGFACAILKRLGLQHPIRNMWEEALVAELDSQRKSVMFAEGEEEIALLWTLVDAIKANLPELYHILGDHPPVFVHQFTLAVLGAWAPDEMTKEALRQAARSATPTSAEIEHFPSNPFTIKTDPITGEESLAGWKKATVQHFTEMKSYDRARKPARSVGRPKGLPKSKKSGKQSVSPEEALRAYSMNSDEVHWRDIAKALWPSMKPAALRSDATRLRIRYLIERGDRITRKKNRE